MEYRVRFAAVALADFHVLPAEMMPDARAERLRDGFLRREARCEMQFGKLQAVTVGHFAGPKTTVQEPLAELVDGMPDASRLDDIDAGTQNVRAFALHRVGGAIKASISWTARRNPTKRARDMMEWPVFNISKCGTARMAGVF